MYINEHEIARIVWRTANTEACAKAATATEGDPVEREIDSWEECTPVSVRLVYANRGAVETIIEVKQDFGEGITPSLCLCPDDLPLLIQALLAAQRAIGTLNDAARSPEVYAERFELERACKINPAPWEAFGEVVTSDVTTCNACA